MSIQNVCFQSTSSTPDYEALKSQLSSLYGVTSMEINSKKQNVSVDFDDTYTSVDQIQECLDAIGYQLAQ